MELRRGINWKNRYSKNKGNNGILQVLHNATETLKKRMVENTLNSSGSAGLGTGSIRNRAGGTLTPTLSPRERGRAKGLSLSEAGEGVDLLLMVTLEIREFEGCSQEQTLNA